MQSRAKAVPPCDCSCDSRSGFCAGARRADFQKTVPVEPGDRAATGTNRVDIDHRQTDRVIRDSLIEADTCFATLDERDIGTGPAHVERDDVVITR